MYKHPIPQQHGLLLMNKPSGYSSAGCLEKIKRTFDQKKIGHAGTLDPMATGVLLVLLGKGTKLASYLLEGKKTYRGELILGQITDTYDSEGELIQEQDWSGVTLEQVEQDIISWTQLKKQEVPPVSAAKYKGVPLYKLHRAGKKVPQKIKPIQIFESTPLIIDLPRVSFTVTCSQGTYVRSLAHSLGIRLGCGAVLSGLTREKSHPFHLADAYGLDEILADPESFPLKVLPLEECLPHWVRLSLTSEQEGQVKNGIRLEVAETAWVDPRPEPGLRAMMVTSSGSSMALAEMIEDNHVLKWSILRGLWS